MKDSTDGLENPIFGDQTIGHWREFREGHPLLIRVYDDEGKVVNEYMSLYLTDDLPDGGKRYGTVVNFVKWAEVGRTAIVSLGYDEQGNFSRTFKVAVSPNKMLILVIRDGAYHENAPNGWHTYQPGDNVFLWFESLSKEDLIALVNNPGQAESPSIIGMVRTGNPR